MRQEAPSADGTMVVYEQTGKGSPIVIVHGGCQRASDWARVARRITGRFSVACVDRSLYAGARPVAQHSIAGEVADLLAVVTRVGAPVILVGHSSGGIVALELALGHASLLTGMVLYEPPVAVDAPLGGAALIQSEAAIARGDPSEAMAIHLRELVKLPSALIWLARRIRPLWREMCRYTREQIADNRAIESLGVGLERYRTITTPVLLLGGRRSPRHLHRRLEALAAALPHSRTIMARRWGHLAHVRDPYRLAQLLSKFAAKCVCPRAR